MKTNVKHNLYAVGMFLLIAVLTLLVASCSPTGFVAKCPTYVYEYIRPDGTFGIEEYTVPYDVGDTIEIIPSGEIRVITKVSLKSI